MLSERFFLPEEEEEKERVACLQNPCEEEGRCCHETQPLTGRALQGQDQPYGLNVRRAGLYHVLDPEYLYLGVPAGRPALRWPLL